MTTKKKVVQTTEVNENRKYYCTYIPQMDDCGVISTITDIGLDDMESENKNLSEIAQERVENDYDENDEYAPKEYYEVEVTVKVSGPKKIPTTKKQSKSVRW